MNASRFVTLSTARPHAAEPVIHLRALGMSVRVRVPGTPHGQSLAVFETMNSALSGSPKLRRPEDEIFQILSGRFVFEVDGRRLLARKGDLVVVPGGTSRTYVNVTGTGARQQVTMHPGIDVAAFFRELAEATDPQETVDAVRQCMHLRQIEDRWGVQFLGPGLTQEGLRASLPVFRL
jgi:mannose-6-phosphate isomerase-like protein (cupin superfamily)